MIRSETNGTAAAAAQLIDKRRCRRAAGSEEPVGHSPKGDGWRTPRRFGGGEACGMMANRRAKRRLHIVGVVRPRARRTPNAPVGLDHAPLRGTTIGVRGDGSFRPKHRFGEGSSCWGWRGDSIPAH